MKINLKEKLSAIAEYWHPYIIGELNDNHIKLARLKGEFVWHNHENEDELFVVVSGTLMVDFRDKSVEVGTGEILVVPKGVEHRPWTKNDEEVTVLLIEPKTTKHTGDLITEKTVQNLEWI